MWAEIADKRCCGNRGQAVLAVLASRYMRSALKSAQRCHCDHERAQCLLSCPMCHSIFCAHHGQSNKEKMNIPLFFSCDKFYNRFSFCASHPLLCLLASVSKPSCCWRQLQSVHTWMTVDEEADCGNRRSVKDLYTLRVCVRMCLGEERHR